MNNYQIKEPIEQVAKGASFNLFIEAAKANDKERLLSLVNESIEIAYPYLKVIEGEKRVLGFLTGLSKTHAQVVSKWMVYGFVHGNLNLENMTIGGGNKDLSSAEYLPYYDRRYISSKIKNNNNNNEDHSYGQQADLIYQNVKELAFSFLILDIEKAKILSAIQNFSKVFAESVMNDFLKRLNLEPLNVVENNKLFSLSFTFLQSSRVGFEDFFKDWCGGEESAYSAMTSARASFYKGNDFNAFYNQLKSFKVCN